MDGIGAAEQAPAELMAPEPRFLGRIHRRPVSDHRQVVVALGMHRSGTSLLSNILHLLGVDMVGDTVHVSPSNPTGFWEREDITIIHDEILKIIERPIANPSHVLPFAPGWWRDLRLREPKQRLRELLRRQLQEVSGVWGFKDPRTCRLLPLWGEIFDELEISPRFVWAVRNPAEAARSMILKNPKHRPLTLPQSELMWLAYNYDIARYVALHRPIVIAYEDWFDSPIATAERLAAELELLWRGTPEDLSDLLAWLVNDEYRHHRTSDQHKVSLPLCSALYDGLLAFSVDGDFRNLDTLIGNVRSLFATLQPLLDTQRVAANLTLVQGLDEASVKFDRTRTNAVEGVELPPHRLSDEVAL